MSNIASKYILKYIHSYQSRLCIFSHFHIQNNLSHNLKHYEKAWLYIFKAYYNKRHIAISPPLFEHTCPSIPGTFRSTWKSAVDNAVASHHTMEKQVHKNMTLHPVSLIQAARAAYLKTLWKEDSGAAAESGKIDGRSVFDMRGRIWSSVNDSVSSRL